MGGGGEEEEEEEGRKGHCEVGVGVCCVPSEIDPF